MALNFVETDHRGELAPRITVFGVGGAGGNAVNNMIDKNLEGVEFVVANTDAQALSQNKAKGRIQMGVKITEGLGAGARPSVGSAAAEETIEEIIDHLAGSHMCFITAGMGGGTGTGAAPIIAQAARELGVLTVGVVTKPFQFEGAKRMRQAEEGVEALQKVVDTLIIIPNQNLFRLANEKTTFTEAFAMADDVLYQGVKGVTDLMVRPGLINLDFADVRAVMDEMGKAMMGTGEATGEDRAIQAAEKAIANPLLDEISLHGAKGVLINITGGYDLTLFELDEAANRIREKVDPDANIIVGSTLDPEMEGALRVSVVATGIDAQPNAQDFEIPRRRFAEPVRAHLEPVSHRRNEEQQLPEQSEPEIEPEYQQHEAYAQHEPEQPNLFAPEPQHVEAKQAGAARAGFSSRRYEPAPSPQQQAPQQQAPQARRQEAPDRRGYTSRPQSGAVQQQPMPQAEVAQSREIQSREIQSRGQDMQREQARVERAQAPTHEDNRGYDPRHDHEQYAYDDGSEGFDIDSVFTDQGAGQRGQQDPAAQFTAPRRNSPGIPSPETLARLQRAVQKGSERAAHPQARPQPAPAPEAEQRSSRFGIGSLIRRMAGHGSEGGGTASAQRRMAPPVTQYEEETAQPEHDERIEVPAFLRRQAN